MAAMTLRSADRGVRSSGRKAASARWMGWLARAGLTARGINYLLIGALAVQIGLCIGGRATDRLGALRAVAVALGLMTFGVYSCCEARWRKVQLG
jgi:hypothetical protein